MVRSSLDFFRKEEIICCPQGQLGDLQVTREGAGRELASWPACGLLADSISSSTYEGKVTTTAICLNHRVLLRLGGGGGATAMPSPPLKV